MDIVTYRDANPLPTEFIRIPISGPKPWNQLVFLRCNGSGRPYTGNNFLRYRVRFSSEFRIDDFKQAKLDWYQKNTYISAALFFQRLSMNTEMNFIAAAEAVTGFVDPDGRIGFESQIAMFLGGSDLFEDRGSLSFAYSISAYVLLYEPTDEPPPAVPPTKPGWMPKIEVLDPQFGSRRNIIFTDDPSMLRKPPE